jgi:Ni,Fe-hydrogenase maturation factor
MKVYVFGNEDVECDKIGLKVAEKLEKTLENVKFVTLKPNENLPFTNKESAVIIDVISEIKKVIIIEDSDLEKITPPPRSTAHDFDLGFQLKYLKKLGKLGKITIIGLPMTGEIDYDLIHSTLRKLVAQDMQGS